MAEHGEVGCQISGSPRQEPEADIRVIRLPGKRLGVAAGLLARCFHANQTFVDLFADEGDRSRALPRMFAAGLRGALGFGHVYAATRGARSPTGDELAVWLPPGAFLLSVARLPPYARHVGSQVHERHGEAPSRPSVLVPGKWSG